MLDNIGELRHDGDEPYWEAVIIQISFMIVLTCHIPFIFFSGKEALCIMIDEVQRKSISSALWHKLQTNEHFSKRLDAQEPPNPNLPIPGDSTKEAFDSFLSGVDRKSQTDVKAALRASKLRSKAIMSHISAAVAQKLAYKDMNNFSYYTACLSFYTVVLLGAIFIEDVAQIFDFVSAISVSAIAFFIPGGFYLMIEKRFPQELPNRTRNISLSWLFIVLGFVNFCLGITSTTYGLISGGE